MKNTTVCFLFQLEIAEFALDQAGTANERRLAFVDKNRDLYITNVRVIGATRKINKLGTNIHNFVWNDAYNMLAGIADARFTIWYYPGVVYVDKNLLTRTIFQRDAIEYGKNPTLLSFLGNHVIMRTSDGSVIHSVIPAYATVLHAYIGSNSWDDALKLCRFVKVNRIFLFIIRINSGCFGTFSLLLFQHIQKNYSQTLKI